MKFKHVLNVNDTGHNPPRPAQTPPEDDEGEDGEG